MLINVPQYIDVEDKVAGPLTLKQLGWMIVLGVILLILWNMLPLAGFVVMALPLALFFVALAFYKPYGQSMSSFIVFGFMYFFKPKIYVWKRSGQGAITIPKAAGKAEKKAEPKHLSSDSLHNLAELLDSEGTSYNEKVVDILKKPPTKKA